MDYKWTSRVISCR